MRSTKRYPLILMTMAFAAVLALAASPAPAAAYVGPGAALSLLGALWGVLLAIGAAVAFAVAWPIRRYLRTRRARNAEGETGHAAERSPRGASGRAPTPRSGPHAASGT